MTSAPPNFASAIHSHGNSSKYILCLAALLDTESSVKAYSPPLSRGLRPAMVRTRIHTTRAELHAYKHPQESIEASTQERTTKKKLRIKHKGNVYVTFQITFYLNSKLNMLL